MNASSSLSLALGLSGLRSVQLPIETVLIDEGFGSLDGEHVDSVIQGLEALGRGQGALQSELSVMWKDDGAHSVFYHGRRASNRGDAAVKQAQIASK